LLQVFAVTDSSDPSRRSSRKPPTIDLTATVVDDAAGKEAKTAEAGEHPAAEAATPAGAERQDDATESMLEGAPANDPTAPEPAAAAPAVEPSERESARAGFGTVLASGLLGGLVGAGAILAYQAWRPAAVPSDPRVAALEQRFAALPQTDTSALERRLSALEGAQNGLAQRAQAAQELAGRAAARAEEAFNRPAPAAAPVTAPPASDGAVAELGNRIAALETQLREQVEAAAGERRTIQQSLEGTAGATQALERRLAEQEQRLAALPRQLEEAGGEANRASTRLVLANRLDAALRDGAPYREVLEGLRRTGADPATLSTLEPFAEQGAPTAAALAQSFRPVAERIAEALRPPPQSTAPAETQSAPAASGSWTDRLVGLLGQVVTIRPADAPRRSEGTAGQPAGAPVAPIEQALARGDLAAAAAAWDALPEPARQASAEWGQQLKQRAAAEAAARTLAANAVAALNSSTR
jgi:hypothetical protein